MPTTNPDCILITLANAAELFDAPPTARRAYPGDEDRRWDDIGATLGEPGVGRLLLMALENPRATRLVIRILHTPDASTAHAADELTERLRRWCRCKIIFNSKTISLRRSFGLRALYKALAALALALAASWALQSETFHEPAGPLRTLIAEALVIAGWVVMWRPIEMIFFDSMRIQLDNRLLNQLLRIPWTVELATPPTPTPTPPNSTPPPID
ncbi:MAG: hypothetical protein ACK5VC_06230 [bacterium]